MKILLKNGTIVNPNGKIRGSVLIQDQTIEKIIPNNSSKDSEDKNKDIDIKRDFDIDPAILYDVEIDCSSKYILPGIIDPHVHLRDMAQDYKETVQTGTFAAISNGITTVLAMPNTNPRLSTPESIEKYSTLLEQGIYSNVGIFGNVSDGFKIETLKKMVEMGCFGLKLYPGDTSSDFPLDWDAILEIERVLRGEYTGNYIDFKQLIKKFNDFLDENNNYEKFSKRIQNWVILFNEAAKLDIPILFHPDLPISKSERATIFEEAVQCGVSQLEAHSQTFSKLQELLHNLFVFKILEIAAKESAEKAENFKSPRIHFCHVSCPESVELINYFKGTFENLKVKVNIEVTPHHLLLHYNRKLTNPAFSKVLQPVRSPKDISIMKEMLRKNQIAYIGTDHAPHTLEEKSKPFIDAPSGFPGLDIYLKVMLSEVMEGFISIEKFTKYSSFAPAKIFGIPKKGEIRQGYDADIIIIEQTQPYVVNSDNFLSKSKVCPYDLSKIRVKLCQVFLGGKLISNTDSELIQKFPPFKKYIDQKTGKKIKF